MAKLIYSALASLDGYIEDADGGFEWAAPDEQVHMAVNDLERQVGTHLYGRRMFEVMAVWETMDTGPDQHPAMRDYAEIWRAAEKIVYSQTLESVSTADTRLERVFDPAQVRALKAAATRDISIGGPELAGAAFTAGLVDEIMLLLTPVIVGGGKPALPADVHLNLELLDERRFNNGTVLLRYSVGEER